VRVTEAGSGMGARPMRDISRTSGRDDSYQT